jgi:hypothetical protein
MRKYGRFTLFITILLISIFFTTGCNAVLVEADEEIEPGEMETRQYDFDEFIMVDIGSAFSYEIQKADNWSISITAGSNLFKHISVTESGQELDIDISFPGITLWGNNSYWRPRAIITMPELAGLDSSGATDGTVTGFRSDGELDISMSGASKLDLGDISVVAATMDMSGASQVTGNIQADSIELDINSASKVRLDGSADYLTVEASGASKLELQDFISQNADITLRNASRGAFNLVKTLDARVSGASTLEYTGEPAIGILDVTGASTFRKK